MKENLHGLELPDGLVLQKGLQPFVRVEIDDQVVRLEHHHSGKNRGYGASRMRAKVRWVRWFD